MPVHIVHIKVRQTVVLGTGTSARASLSGPILEGRILETAAWSLGQVLTQKN